MYVIEIGSAIVGRCLPTPGRLRGGFEQTTPEPLIEGGQAVVRGVLGIAARLVDIPEELRQPVTVASLLTDTELSTDRARQVYLDLVGRGGVTVATLRANPQLARALDGLATASTLSISGYRTSPTKCTTAAKNYSVGRT